MKIVPEYNDNAFIQHADDQINDGSGSGNDHENERTVIGSAIESYQGFLTVEVFMDGGKLYSERLCETLKVIPVDTSSYNNQTIHFVFRLRTAWGSGAYYDVDQYVYIANHSSCGSFGGPAVSLSATTNDKHYWRIRTKDASEAVSGWSSYNQTDDADNNWFELT